MDVDVGAIIAGKYEVEKLIGQGGMGDVWRARHVQLGERVAVKVLRVCEDDDASARSRFDLEAKIAARLSRRSRHVVAVIDQGEENGSAFLVMELLDGESLEELLGRTGVLPMPLAATIATHIARALLCAHAEGVIHRDLKPANVFLTKDEDGQVLAKLVDFGIARVLQQRAASVDIRAVRRTRRGMVIGTPAYMSPEQAKGARNVGPECDVWALAATSYECLTGQPPFSGELDAAIERMCRGDAPPVTSLRADAPLALDVVFARAFSPAKEDRYQSAQAFADAFVRALGDAATTPTHHTPPGASAVATPIAPRRARRSVWLGLGAAGAVLFAGAVVLAWRRAPADTAPVTATASTSAPSAPVTAVVPTTPPEFFSVTVPVVNVTSLPPAGLAKPPAAKSSVTSTASATPSRAPALPAAKPSGSLDKSEIF